MLETATLSTKHYRLRPSLIRRYRVHPSCMSLVFLI